MQDSNRRLTCKGPEMERFTSDMCAAALKDPIGQSILNEPFLYDADMCVGCCSQTPRGGLWIKSDSSGLLLVLVLSSSITREVQVTLTCSNHSNPVLWNYAIFSEVKRQKRHSPFNHVQTSGLGARATSHYLWWLNSASTSNKGFAEVMAATQKCRTRFLKVKGKPCNVISGWMLWGSERLQSGSPSIWCEHMRPHWVNVQMEDGWAQSVLLRKWEDCRRGDS